MTDVVKILRAFRPGDVVFIETDNQISLEHQEKMVAHLSDALKDTGVRVVLLNKGMRVACAEEETVNVVSQ